MTVSVTRGLQRQGLWSAGNPSPCFSCRTCGPSPRLTATIVGCAGSADRLGSTRSPATSVGRGRVSGQRRRGLVLHDPLRRGPRGGRVTVGGRVGRAEDVHHVGITLGPSGIRLGDQVGQLGALPRAHPHRRRHRHRGRHGQGAAEIDRLLGRQRHRRPRSARCRAPGRSPACPSSSDPRSQPAIAEPGGGPGTCTVCRRSTWWANPDASYWVIDRSVMPNCTPGGAVVGAGGGDPHPRGFAVGQRRRERLAGLVEPQGGAAVGGFDQDAADLGADGGRAGCDGDGGVGHRVVEIHLQPLTDGGLQRVGHPRGRRVAVDRGGRGGRRVRRRASRWNPTTSSTR